MSRASILRLGALSCIWGASFLFIKVSLEGLSPTQVALGRVTAGAVVLAVAVAVTGQRMPWSWPLAGHLAFLALVGNVLPFFLFAWGEERIASGLAGILNGTTPLLTLVVAMLLLPEERASWARVVGVALGFVGVVLIVGPWRAELSGDSVAGQLACLAAAACYGVTFTYTRRFVAQRGHPSLLLAAGQLGAATLLLWIAAPVIASDPVELTPRVLGSILALGALGTGIAYLLFYALIRDEAATTASMVTYLIPIVAVILGVVVLDEPLTWNAFAGAAVVILAVLVAEGRLPVSRTDASLASEMGTPGA